MGSAIPGAIIGLLFGYCISMGKYGETNLHDFYGAIADCTAPGVINAMAGGVIGLILGRDSKTGNKILLGTVGIWMN